MVAFFVIGATRKDERNEYYKIHRTTTPSKRRYEQT